MFLNIMVRWWLVFLIVGIIIIVAFILATPWDIANLTSHPHPVQSYREALQRIKALEAKESHDMNPVCRLQFLTHGQEVEQTIIMVHGYTSCPQQFHDLGQKFYELGYNVLIAPLPHHGLADRMTEDQASLKAEELVTYADNVVDIAQGLGKQVVMIGISAGGVTTAWAAQNRSDIDLAVIISPAFGYHQIPTQLTALVMNYYLVKPNSFVWWDPTLKADLLPARAYPQYSTHALAELLRLGFAVQTAARRSPPAAHSILLVTNANDTSVNNALTAEVAKNWRSHGANLKTYEFGADLQLIHDLIDPDQPGAHIDIVYPELIDLIGS